MKLRYSLAAVLAVLAVLAGTSAPAADGKPKGLRALKPPPDTTFSLTDHRGRRVSDADYRGKYLLVYFGYTFCPDVCPTDLQAMSEAVDKLDAAGLEVQPIFVSVDPERDTAVQLAGYVDAFHPRLIGLTGTHEEIARTAKGYRVRYFKLHYPVENEDAKDDDEATTAEYAVHHSAFTYLVGPRGRGLMTFPHGEWPDDMAAKILRVVSGES